MALTEEYILEVRDEIQSRVRSNDRLFDKFFKKNVLAKHKAKFPELEHEFIDFFFIKRSNKPIYIFRFIINVVKKEINKLMLQFWKFSFMFSKNIFFEKLIEQPII